MAAFTEQVVALQNLGSSLTESLEFLQTAHREEVSFLKDRITDLEGRLDRNEIEGKFIIDGVDETENENTSAVVQKIIADHAGVSISSSEILSAVRLGRPRGSGQHEDRGCSRRQRILVCSVSQHIKLRVLTGKRPMTQSGHSRSIFINEDLTKLERSRGEVWCLCAKPFGETTFALNYAGMSWSLTAEYITLMKLEGAAAAFA